MLQGGHGSPSLEGLWGMSSLSQKEGRGCGRPREPQITQSPNALWSINCPHFSVLPEICILTLLKQWPDQSKNNGQIWKISTWMKKKVKCSHYKHTSWSLRNIFNPTDQFFSWNSHSLMLNVKLIVRMLKSHYSRESHQNSLIFYKYKEELGLTLLFTIQCINTKIRNLWFYYRK